MVDLSAFERIKKTGSLERTTGNVDLSAFGKISTPRVKTTPLPRQNIAPQAQNEPISPVSPVGEGITPVAAERAKIGQDLTKSITDFIQTTLLPKIAPETTKPSPLITPGKKTDIKQITGKVDLSAFGRVGKDFTGT